MASTAALAASAAGGSALVAGGASTMQSNVTARHEVNAGALSVDAAGAFAVLAGRKGLHVLDLEAPYAAVGTVHHPSKWEVAVVKCSPHVLFRGHVASTSNRQTLIWNISYASAAGSSANGGGNPVPGGSSAVEGTSIGGAPRGLDEAGSHAVVATLRAHTRPVSDVSWSLADPMLLATCSADTKTHLWDVRAPQKPVQTLSAFTASAVQVEWNRVDQYCLATAHDGEVRVWDTRVSDKPTALVTAHMQKIYGIDWHPQRMYELVTCSEDKTVKFWDVTQPRVCQGSLTTGAPVWRARYTPFGNGLVTISQRLDNSLRLWSLSHADSSRISVDPVHTFAGHHDLVRGMAWRSRPSIGAFQLVSWSKDQELRLWRVDPQHLEACGYDTTGYTDATPSEPAEMVHSDFFHLQMQSKYDISALRNDFVPLVVPKAAAPLEPSEYYLEGNNTSLQALLALEEDLIKGGEPESSSDEESKRSSDVSADGSKGLKDKSSSSDGACSLPCPRFSGACFSGPNMLLVFDSRVAIGQSRSSVVPSAAAAGKVKAPAPAIKIPRTYDELLDMRDSRFASKKNKKPPVKLMSSTNMLGAMDLASDWGQQDLDAPSYSDEVEGSMHGFRTSSMFFSSTTDSSGDMDMPIHGGSEYLKTYFANSEYHLPVNHPDHRISVPTNPNPGAGLSPRASTVRASTSDRSKRVEQAAPALNLDLSLSVTILDLSRLCGLSSILTYKTDVAARDLIVDDEEQRVKDKRKASKRSSALVSWMLEASKLASSADPMSLRGGKKKAKHMSHILRSLLNEKHSRGEDDKSQTSRSERDFDVAMTCAENSRIAGLAGRNDLQQIWRLLEISSTPTVQLPIFANTQSEYLTTTHPWSAHPFGKGLVKRVLDMYEQTGDLQTLASIVCALKPNEVPKAGKNRNDDTTDQHEQELNGLTSDGVRAEESPSGSLSSRSAKAVRHTRAGDAVELGDIPPAMNIVRRTTSYNGSVQTGDVSGGKTSGRERRAADSSPARSLSPVRDQHQRGSDVTGRDGRDSTSAWKVDFEKLENPFKTWGGPSKEPQPRRLSDDMFLPPTASIPTLSPKLSPGLPAQVEEVPRVELGVKDVVSLNLDFRSADNDRCLLSSEDEARYDVYKEAYAEVLYRYGAMNLRNDILKTRSTSSDEVAGVALGQICSTCQSVRRYCVICQILHCTTKWETKWVTV